MKFKISIKTFAALFVILFMSVGTLAIYKFYSNEKAMIGRLISLELKNRILTLSFMVKKSLQSSRDINLIKSRLDNVVITNDIIEDLYILDDKNRTIYSSNRKKFKIDSPVCVNAVKLDSKRLFKSRVCMFDLPLYRGDTLYKYKMYIVINHRYLNSILRESFFKSLQYFIWLIIFLLVLLGVFLKRIIITPLEKLRQFASHHIGSPKPFFIKEFESIRASLAKTFSKLEKEQNDLYKLSTRDALTGLYNRLSLFDKVNELIIQSKRGNNIFAVLYVDIDNFKDINDLKGHDVGDQILREISKRLLKSVRMDDFVARIGGDEFVVVLNNYGNNIHLVEIVERILKNVSKPITVKSELFKMYASIGIVIYPKNGKSTNELIKNADIAMYKAKKLRKNKFYFFTKKMNDLLYQKLTIKNKLVEALKHNHFKLYYQPKVDISTNKIVSCEALIRWVDPERGLIPPDQFIPIAEESGFISKLGEWVLEEGVRQLKKWENTKMESVVISVNVSAKQFNDTNFFSKVKHITEKIDRSRFDLEITESAFLKKSTKNIETIKRLKGLGLSISLDDFGTGYSSLSYLRQIPIDTIKIDKSFIDDYKEKRGRSFIMLIVDLGKTLHLNTVAEGVETQEQFDFLKEIGCDLYQGYLCSKPLPSDEFEKLYFDFNAA